MSMSKECISELRQSVKACCMPKGQAECGLKRVAIVGSPNVGKSLLFNGLTGRYVTVSNYPGTTVEISRGKSQIDDEEFEVIDSTGMYSLISITE